MDSYTESEIIKNFKSRNVDIEFFNTLEDVKNRIVNLIPIESSCRIKEMCRL